MRADVSPVTATVLTLEAHISRLICQKQSRTMYVNDILEWLSRIGISILPIGVCVRFTLKHVSVNMPLFLFLQISNMGSEGPKSTMILLDVGLYVSVW
jgi:hypothetical protein